jgi:predicted PurR-regulated permease PerM
VLVDWIERGLPMPPGQLRALLSELRRVSVSVIGAQLASGLVQTVVATIGYAIAGLPSPVLLGALTLPASLIPTPGTAIIGLPLAALLWLTGRPGWAIFLAAWMTLFVGLIDNVIRPILVRGGTGLNGALILFALLGGLLAFGFIGLIVGPLALALFLSVANVRRRERAEVFIDKEP